VKNITDKITKTSANIAATAFGSSIDGAVSSPRTYGVEVGYRF
jgi:hypothetical protein